MGRSKIIENKELLKLIEEYFYTVCDGRLTRFDFVHIAEYVKNCGYPNFKDYTLRKNPVARDKIEELRNLTGKKVIKVATYKTLDVADFLQKHPTEQSLIKGLSALSIYYKEVSDSATEIFSQLKNYEDEIEQLKESLKEKEKSLEKADKKIEKLKDKNEQLEQEKNKYKNVVDKYVYPEIANKILKEAGVANLSSDHIIEEPEVVEPDNIIPFKGRMISMFKGDDDD